VSLDGEIQLDKELVNMTEFAIGNVIKPNIVRKCKQKIALVINDILFVLLNLFSLPFVV